MFRRALPALGVLTLTALAAPAALAGPPAERALTAGEQRLLDGAYIYLVSPEHCDPALPADRLRAWIAGLIRRHAVPVSAAAEYLADQEPRLRLVAEAAFNGRRGPDLCHAIHALGDTTPELRPTK